MELREIIVNYNNTGKTYQSIRSGSDVADVIRKCLVTNAKENFIALYLSGSHEVIAYNVVTIGLANVTQTHPREIFQPAIACGACAVVIAHNHPSGALTASYEDKKVTKRIKEASDILGIKLLDHVIVTDSSYYSFAENGEI